MAGKRCSVRWSAQAKCQAAGLVALAGWRCCAGAALPAAHGGADQPRTRLFCIMTFAPGTLEMALLAKQSSEGVGVFGCDGHAVFSSTSGESSNVSGSALVDKIWQVVFDEPRYADFDWTVRVNMDTIILPQRLRKIAERHCSPGAECPPLYIQDDLDTATQPVELISANAMKYLAANSEACRHSGMEDAQHSVKGAWYFTPCLQALGLSPQREETILKSLKDRTSECDSVHAAFSPMADWEDVSRCLKAVDQPSSAPATTERPSPATPASTSARSSSARATAAPSHSSAPATTSRSSHPGSPEDKHPEPTHHVDTTPAPAHGAVAELGDGSRSAATPQSLLQSIGAGCMVAGVAIAALVAVTLRRNTGAQASLVLGGGSQAGEKVETSPLLRDMSINDAQDASHLQLVAIDERDRGMSNASGALRGAFMLLPADDVEAAPAGTSSNDAPA